MRMLLKTISRLLPQNVGKRLAPTDRLITLGKRLCMSAKPAAPPAASHQGMETFKSPFSEGEVPTIPPQLNMLI